MNAAITVIIPTYNRSVLMARAIRSVLAAIQEGDEILVVDDGSTDDTEAVVRSFGEPVRYHGTANSGPGAARNTGMRLAKHDLIAFLDSDDEYSPEKLLLQRQVMLKYPDLLFCFSNLAFKGSDGVYISDLLSVWQTDNNIGSPFPTKHARELFGPGMAFSSVCELPEGIPDFGIHFGKFAHETMDAFYTHSDTVLLRRSKAGACEYPEDARPMEDCEFMIFLSRMGPVAYLDRSLATLYSHEGPRVASVDHLIQVNARLRILKRGWGSLPRTSDCDWTRYEALVHLYEMKRAKILLRTGRPKEARSEFDAIGAPLAYRLFARLPVFLGSNVYRTVLGLKDRISSESL